MWIELNWSLIYTEFRTHAMMINDGLFACPVDQFKACFWFLSPLSIRAKGHRRCPFRLDLSGEQKPEVNYALRTNIDMEPAGKSFDKEKEKERRRRRKNQNLFFGKMKWERGWFSECQKESASQSQKNFLNAFVLILFAHDRFQWKYKTSKGDSNDKGQSEVSEALVLGVAIYDVALRCLSWLEK